MSCKNAFLEKTLYTRLGHEDEAPIALGENAGKPHPGSKSVYMKLSIGIICLIIALVGAILYLLRPQHLSIIDRSKAINSPCGKTSAEAQARGCNWDQLTWSWLPSYCPQYTNQPFLEEQLDEPYRYWDNYKRAGTPYHGNETDWPKVLDSGVQLYGERREHLTHCVYLLLAGAQIASQGAKRYTIEQVDYEHMEHCSIMLMKSIRSAPGWYDVQTKVPPAGFMDC